MKPDDELRVLVPEINFTRDQKLWINELFKINKEGKQFNARSIIKNLSKRHKFPIDFDNKSISDLYVLDNNITLIGVLVLIPDYNVISKSISLLLDLREYIYENESLLDIRLRNIQKNTTQDNREKSFLLKLLSPFFSLFKTFEGEDEIIYKIVLDEEIVGEYLKLTEQIIIQNISKHIKEIKLSNEPENLKESPIESSDEDVIRIIEKSLPNFYNVHILYPNPYFNQPDKDINLQAVSKIEINKYIDAIVNGKKNVSLTGKKYMVKVPTEFEIYDFKNVKENISFPTKGAYLDYVEEYSKSFGTLREAFKRMGVNVTNEIITDFSFMDIEEKNEIISSDEAEKGPNTKLPPEKEEKQILKESTSEIPDENEQINTTISHKPIKIEDKSLKPSFNVGIITEEFSEIITNFRKENGQMIGILGSWGRGKTYFVKQLCYQLNLSFNEQRISCFRKFKKWIRYLLLLSIFRNKWKKIKPRFSKKPSSDFILIKFHAWKYQKTPAVWAHLYEVFINKYLDVWWGKKIIRTFKLNLKREGYWNICIWLSFSIIFVAIWYFVSSLFVEIDSWGFIIQWAGASLPVILFFSKINDFVKFSKKPLRTIIKGLTSHPSFIEHLGLQAEIQKELRILLNTWLTKSLEKRILLFVDDIDRCSYDNMIDLVDALRVMLEEPDIIKRLVVIIALDETKLKHAIHIKYNDSKLKNKDLEKVATEYLDKLFILCLKLPDLSYDQKKEYLENLINLKGGFSENQPENHLTSSTSTRDYAEKAASDANTAVEVVNDAFKSMEKMGIKIKSEQQSQVDQSSTAKISGHKDITRQEFTQLLKSCDNYDISSPRLIRIQYYRYLLARNLWKKLYFNQQFPSDIMINSLIDTIKDSSNTSVTLTEEQNYIIDMVKTY